MDEELREFVGRWVRFAIILAIVGIVLNDGIQLARGYSTASKGLNAAISASLDSAAKAPDAIDVAKAAAIEAAKGRGAQVDSYAQVVGESLGGRRAQVTMSVSARLGKTVIAAPIVGLIRGAASSTWYSDARVSLRARKQVDVFGTAQ
jgi:hypothetical protein